jgi:hypothetical protein
VPLQIAKQFKYTAEARGAEIFQARRRHLAVGRPLHSRAFDVTTVVKREDRHY